MLQSLALLTAMVYSHLSILPPPPSILLRRGRHRLPVKGLDDSIIPGPHRNTVDCPNAEQFIPTSFLEELKVDARALEYVSLVDIPGNQEESDETNSNHTTSIISTSHAFLDFQAYLIQFMFSSVTGYEVGMQ